MIVVFPDHTHLVFKKIYHYFSFFVVVFSLAGYSSDVFSTSYSSGCGREHYKSNVPFLQVGLITSTWGKVFRIIPELRILRLTFHTKSASKY